MAGMPGDAACEGICWHASSRLAAVDSVGHASGLFWKKRWVELKDAKLICWATRGVAPHKRP